MKNILIICFVILFSIPFLSSQNRAYEVGIELDDISFSNLGGRFGAGLKFSIVEDETMAFGPSIRFNRFWSKNQFTGIEGSGTFFGGGAFFHYRTMDWFFLGSEIEFLQNPFKTIKPSQTWSLTAFLGGGVSRATPIGILNLGVFYDVADALRDPLTTNPSPLRNSYFIKRQNPNPEQAGQPSGAYLPIIYRFAFFIPLG
jgi:opacity protein-like surface antigen